MTKIRHRTYFSNRTWCGRSVLLPSAIKWENVSCLKCLELAGNYFDNDKFEKLIVKQKTFRRTSKFKKEMNELLK